MIKKKTTKKEVYFIATKYKNQPANVSFYTKEGEKVPESKVEKEPTKKGIRLFTFATN